MPENQFEALEIYIDYDRLTASDLSRLLSNLSFVSNKIAEDYFARFEDYGDGQFPSLDIDTINTGGSIRFKLVEGWTPTFTNSSEADIVVGIPKKLGIPVVIGYLLISTANGYQDFRNTQLDNELKELEIELKRIELAKAMAPDTRGEEQNTLRFVANYVDNKIPEIKPVIMDTIKTVLRNPAFTTVRVNGAAIKGRSQQ